MAASRLRTPSSATWLTSALVLSLSLGFAGMAAALPNGFGETLYLGGPPPATFPLTDPMALAWSPDGSRLFIAEKGGRLKVWNGTTLSVALTLSVQAFDEQGLLGLALDPGFPAQPYIYLLYDPSTNPQQFSFHRISRFTFDSGTNTVVAGSEVILHTGLPTGNGYHVGGCLRTSPAGYLFATVGETGYGLYAQDLTRLEGKMIRLNLDGTIPTDNPFYNTSGAKKEIYHRGLRNPFRFAIQPGTGQPFISDVGDSKREELDTGPAGCNFGWGAPTNYEGIVTNPAPGITNPIYAYSTGGDVASSAIVGSTFYTGPGFPAGYTGNLFVLDHCRGKIFRVVLDALNNVASVDTTWGDTQGKYWYTGPVDLCQGPDGALYYTSLGPQAVKRIAYTLTTGVGDGPKAPTLALTAAPNPFASRTRIHFSIRQAGHVRLQLFDVGGRRVRTLVDENRAAGEDNFEWDGRDESGRALPAGLYLARMDSGNEMLTARILLAR